MWWGQRVRTRVYVPPCGFRFSSATHIRMKFGAAVFMFVSGLFWLHEYKLVNNTLMRSAAHILWFSGIDIYIYIWSKTSHSFQCIHKYDNLLQRNPLDPTEKSYGIGRHHREFVNRIDGKRLHTGNRHSAWCRRVTSGVLTFQMRDQFNVSRSVPISTDGFWLIEIESSHRSSDEIRMPEIDAVKIRALGLVFS